MTPDKIKEAVVASLGQIAPEADLTTMSATVPFRDQLDLDSMDFLRFVVDLNARIGVDVPEADYPKMTTLDGCVSYLAARLG